MISSTNAVVPAISPQTSLFGIVSPSNSTSSFADELGDAITGTGSNPPSTKGTPRQNYDAIGGASTCESGATAPIQYSFFQYLMDGAMTDSTATGIAGPSVHAPASGVAPQFSAPNASGADTGWLSPPFYTPPAPVFVSWENPPGVINTTASPETDLQNMAAQYINDPLQFGWGGVSATTPQEFVDNIVSYAQLRAATYPKASREGYDPVATGTKYANLVLDAIKKIQYDTIGESRYASIYDAWVAGVNTWPGATGSPSAT